MKQRVGFKLSQKILSQFEEWCRKAASPETCKYYVRRIEEIDRREKEIDSSRWHVTAYKRFTKFLCEEKSSKRACEEFARVKSVKSHPDNYVPPDNKVLEALKAEGPLGYFYFILVETGLRAKEAARLLSKPVDGCEDLGGYYRCPIMWKRGMKQALWAYVIEPVEPRHVRIEALYDIRYSLRLLPFKYVRKWVTTKMLLSGMQEIAVDFVQGRVPDSVLRKHYANRLVIADKEYGKYAKWLREWLNKIKINIY
ncbi:MAG: hypothetical protein GSR75_00405 [Desulfurococcales archaeon]|nr:hypothetical protein [Desulfurococcales archaeon]